MPVRDVRRRASAYTASIADRSAQAGTRFIFAIARRRQMAVLLSGFFVTQLLPAVELYWATRSGFAAFQAASIARRFSGFRAIQARVYSAAFDGFRFCQSWRRTSASLLHGAQRQCLPASRGAILPYFRQPIRMRAVKRTSPGRPGCRWPTDRQRNEPRRSRMRPDRSTARTWPRRRRGAAEHGDRHTGGWRGGRGS